MIQQSPTERLDGNDIWEALFGIMRGNVPDELTEAVCQQLADALASQSAQPAEADGVEPSDGAGVPAGEPKSLGYHNMGASGRCDWTHLREAVAEAVSGSRAHSKPFDPAYYPGHQQVQGINYNSLDRIVTAFVDAALAATPKAPTSTAGEVAADCSCEVAFGQNEECPAHGTGTAWRAANPQADMRAQPYGQFATPPAPNDDLRAALEAQGERLIAELADAENAGDDEAEEAWHGGAAHGARRMLDIALAALKENRRG